MSKNVVVYNQIGTFVGPCPSSGYHFLTTDGVPTNDENPDTASNLVFPLTRVFQASYGFTESRVDVKGLGYYGTIARPIINHDINLNLTYYQMGLINEARLGFVVNHTADNTSTGIPIYDHRVVPISGFLDRKYESSPEMNLGWPLTTRDARNLFIATSQTPLDLNNRTGSPAFQTDIDVFAFGDCYLTNYKTNGAVRQIPQVSVDFVCNNIQFYNYSSGKNIPAVNPKNFTLVPDKFFSLPNNFEGSGLPTVLIPKDLSVDITRSKELLNSYPVAYWKLDGNANDSIGSNNGSDVDIVYSSVTGLINQGAVMGETGRIEIPYNSTFDLNNLSINTWIYPPTGSATRIIFQKGPNYLPPYSLFLHSSGDVYFRTVNTLGAIHDLHFPMDVAGINRNSWSNVVCTYDGSNKKIYVNGAERTGSSYTETLMTSPDGNMIGAEKTGASYRNYFAGGAIDEVGVWNQALSPSTISILYNDGIGLQPPFSYTPDITNFPVDFADIKIQSYNIDFALNREPLSNLGYRLPMDRRINLPVIVNMDFNVLAGDNATGSLIDLIKEDKEYDIKLNLKYQSNSNRHRGAAILYEFLGAKLNAINIQESVEQYRTVNFSFTSEINPQNTSKGFFISGQLGVPTNLLTGDVYLGDDFFGMGQKMTLLTEWSDFIVISRGGARPLY